MFNVQQNHNDLPLFLVSKSKVTRKTSEVLFTHILKACGFLTTFLMLLLILTEAMFSVDFKRGWAKGEAGEREKMGHLPAACTQTGVARAYL